MRSEHLSHCPHSIEGVQWDSMPGRRPTVPLIYSRDDGTGRGGITAGRENPATARAIITDSQPTQRGHRPHWGLARERRSLRTLKEKKMSRDFLLKIRVTPEEREAVKAAAGYAGLTVSDYVRLRLAQHRVRQTAAERDTARQLARIGANINQIARWANTHTSGIQALDILMRLDELQTEIKALAEPPCS